MNIPTKLYKYETFTTQSLINLKKQIVFFAPPSGFNDPFDCALKAEIAELEPRDVEELRKIYSAKNWPSEVIERIKNTSSEELSSLVYRTALEAIETIIDNFISNRGVSCFSEVNNELLMWAHYADKYQGFCLEFSTDDELFKKAKKVNYVTSMPKLNVKNIQSNGGVLMDLFCTKSKAWKYEKEWRVLHDKANTAYTYPAELLTGVYFGPKTPNAVIEIICLVLLGQNSHVQFYQGKRSDIDFKIEFEKFTYTPYIETLIGKNGT